jgi:hypothetical protein
VAAHRERYFSQVSDHEKQLIAGEIVSTIRISGGRFLKYEVAWDAFIQIDDEASRIKVMRALQYRQRCKKLVMKELEPWAKKEKKCKKNGRRGTSLTNSQEGRKGKNTKGNVALSESQLLAKKESKCTSVQSTAAVADDANFSNKWAKVPTAQHVQDKSKTAQNLALLQNRKVQSLISQRNIQHNLLQMQHIRDLIRARQEIERLRNTLYAMKRENQHLQTLLKQQQEDMHCFISFTHRSHTNPLLTDQKHRGQLVKVVSEEHTIMPSDDCYDGFDDISDSSLSLSVDSVAEDDKHYHVPDNIVDAKQDLLLPQDEGP